MRNIAGFLAIGVAVLSTGCCNTSPDVLDVSRALEPYVIWLRQDQKSFLFFINILSNQRINKDILSFSF
jgi:hypothetical protein